MLYSELQKLTDNLCTYNEYEVINAAYMEAAGTPAEMEKEDAANLWWSLYGLKWEAKKEFHRQLMRDLVSGLTGNQEILDQRFDEISEVVQRARKYFNNEILPFTANKTNRFTDENGDTWSVTRIERDKYLHSDVYSLSLIVKGKKLHVRDFQLSSEYSYI